MSELLNRHIRQVDEHDVVQQIALMEANLCLVKLHPCLPRLVRWNLLLLKTYKGLCLAV